MANPVNAHPFEVHAFSCKACDSVDTDKPATLVNCCLIGAPLLRDYLNAIAEPAYRAQMKNLKQQFTRDADGKNYGTTKKKLKEAMKYK